MHLLFCGSGWFGVVDEVAARLPEGASIAIRDQERPLVEQLANVDVILPSNARIGVAELAAAPRCVLILQPGVGYDGIDLAAAKARGIPVANAPGTNAGAVAEEALLLMLALARKLPESLAAFRAGRIGTPVGGELAGSRLGLVGRGRTASALARAVSGLAMEVVSIDSHATRDELLDLLRGSDVVSIHCPLDDRTRGMFDAAAFAAMKPGALLVNCARGEIVDRSALEAALAGGKLGGVGLDVYWREPWDPAEPLFSHPRVMCMPHLGSTTSGALRRIAEIVADNVARWQRGEPLLHVVSGQ